MHVPPQDPAARPTVTVWIPAQLRSLTGGQETVRVSGGTVREVIDALERLHPGTKARLCDRDSLRPGIAVAVDSQLATLGLLQPLRDGGEVHFLPAVAGGQTANQDGESSPRPRYVILEHDHPVLHWDLMLERGESLRTWRLAAPPEEGRPIAAEPSFDHRRLYLDYEGPVSGNRGTVTAWDRGTFEGRADGAERVVVRLRGRRLGGTVTLERGNGVWSLWLSATD